MNDYANVIASNGERVRIKAGDVVRFRYPVKGHETGVFQYSCGEYCYIQLLLKDEYDQPVIIERYRSEIIV